MEKLFRLVISLSKINSDSQAHPESDLKKSDLILSSWSPWSPVWLAVKGGSPPSHKTMMNCSLALKEVFEHTKQPSAGSPIDCVIILLDTPLLQCLSNSLVRGHHPEKKQGSKVEWNLNWVWEEMKQFEVWRFVHEIEVDSRSFHLCSDIIYYSSLIARSQGTFKTTTNSHSSHRVKALGYLYYTAVVL